MFRSQIDHRQGDKIFLLTSVTKFYFTLLSDLAACLQVTIKINLFLLSLAGMLLHQSIK